MSLNQAINALASLTLFEMMLAIGLGVSIADVLRVVRDPRLLAKAFIASYVLVPAAAVGLLIAFHADPFVAAGFLVAAVCPGAPYGPPLTGLARGDIVVSVGLMVVLAASSALAAPLLLGLLLPFVLQNLSGAPAETPELTIDATRMVTTLLLTQFLPLSIGLALRHVRPALAEAMTRPANQISLLLNLAMLGLILYAQYEMLLAIPLHAYSGMLALVLAGVAAGCLVNGTKAETRSALAIATSVRNVGVALVIVTGAFAGTRAVAAATAFALFQTVVMVFVALAWGRLAARQAGARPPAAVDDAEVISPR
jgi:BASS family bile acid:Na+ symporter